MKQDNTSKRIQVIVATHKPYRMPDDPIYLPLLVGAEQNPTAWDGAKDSEGDSISQKNPNYCELTGLYWAWKNLDADYIGLAHYRRHFSDGKRWKKKTDRIMTGTEAASCLSHADILLPKPRHYWIETNYSQYAHAHHREDLDLTRQVIGDRCPQYIPAFDRIMKKRSGHRFNMLIMKREMLDRYCAWLFDILFSLETMLDISGYSSNDRRVFGFVGERLLDVWIEKNGYRYKELPYIFMEKQNWIVKAGRFLKRKWIRPRQSGRIV